MGHDVVAPDLPCDDPEATFDDYAEVVLSAIPDVEADDLVIVGYSLGGHTAARITDRRPVREIVYVAAMVPEAGASLSEQFRRGDSMLLPEYAVGVEGPDADGMSRWVDFEVFYRTGCHDCAEPVARERFDRLRTQSTKPYGGRFEPASAPDTATRYLLFTEDRLMDNRFWLSEVRTRLGIEPKALNGSHSPMAAQPQELANLLAESKAPGTGRPPAR